MTSNKPLIVWEKWVDPFGEDIDEVKWRDYNSDIKDISDLQSALSNQLEDTEESDDMIPDKTLSKSNKPIKVIASPLGLIPYNEHTASGKIFNFWLGHTNFSITESIKNIIEETDGVEILDIFTRYRFRIGIGKCFNDSETMKLINDRVYKALEKSYAKQ